MGCQDAVEALEMLLEHDPSMSVTEEMFLRVFGQLPTARESKRAKLADIMHEYRKSFNGCSRIKCEKLSSMLTRARAKPRERNACTIYEQPIRIMPSL